MRSSLYITIITRNLAYIFSLIFAFVSMRIILKITLKYGYLCVKKKCNYAYLIGVPWFFGSYLFLLQAYFMRKKTFHIGNLIVFPTKTIKNQFTLSQKNEIYISEFIFSILCAFLCCCSTRCSINMQLYLQR